MSLDLFSPIFPIPHLTQSRLAGEALTAPRVTQRDVARTAKVHNSTVSLALSNSPSIPEATRKRIQTIATHMGYVPDPTLQALVAYRSLRVANAQRGIIAFITNWHTRWGWREVPMHESTFLGARERAVMHGYTIEHFWLGETGLSQTRLSSMFAHRGITGVLLALKQEEQTAPLELDWARLSAVGVGFPTAGPALHRAVSDACGNIRLAVRRATAAGYRRIGLILPRSWDDGAEQAWSMGFAVEQNRLPPVQRVPILFHQDAKDQTHELPRTAAPRVDPARLAQWLSDFRPDVILSWFPHVCMPLLELGLQIPQDIAFVELAKVDIDSQLAGVIQNNQVVGQVAVETLIRQMQQNLRGIPAVPVRMLIEGAWCDGSSMPKAEQLRDVGAVPHRPACGPFASSTCHS